MRVGFLDNSIVVVVDLVSCFRCEWSKVRRSTAFFISEVWNLYRSEMKNIVGLRNSLMSILARLFLFWTLVEAQVGI